MTKWPARAALATSGAWTSHRKVAGAKLQPTIDEKHDTPLEIAMVSDIEDKGGLQLDSVGNSTTAQS